jgi:choline dehydrogenase-like flavoprotein
MAHISAADADKNSYDVIVVGSGAGGGQAAYTLTMDGARVLMLEAGRRYDPAVETPMMQINSEAPLRGSGTPEKPFGFWDATIDGGWQVPEHPRVSVDRDYVLAPDGLLAQRDPEAAFRLLQHLR